MGFFLDRTGGRFLVGLAGPVSFLKPWLFYLFCQSEAGVLCPLFLDPRLASAGRGGGVCELVTTLWSVSLSRYCHTDANATVSEFFDRGFDDEMRAVVARNLESRGINLHPRANLSEVILLL